MIIDNEEQFETYKNKLIKKWKPILEEEREKSVMLVKQLKRISLNFLQILNQFGDML